MGRWIWWIAVGGCSEYDVVAGPGGATGSGGTTAPGACGSQVLPGFDAPYNDTCVNQVATGTFTPVVEWHATSFPGGGGDNVMSTPIVTSVNDDNLDGVIDALDVPDVVMVSYTSSGGSGILRALDGRTGIQIWSNAALALQTTSGVAAGDIDGDGMVELIAVTPTSVVATEHDGAPKWVGPDVSSHIFGLSDVPSISDIDRDGSPEIIVGRAILDADGRLIGAGDHGMGGSGISVGSCSVAVDLDADGVTEVVTGNAAYRIDGSAVWFNGLADGYPAVADFDGDGRAEIAVSGQGELRILDTDGRLIRALAIPGADSAFYGGPPTIADFDGDGAPEIGIAAGSRYSVIEVDGTVVWQRITNDASSGSTGSSVFDFEGDGAAEVVYADQTTLWVFSGIDGQVKLQSDDHNSGTWLEYPVIADVDADGHAEIIVAHELQFGGRTGITVFGDRDDSWRPGRRTWNQHAYHITNVDEGGQIPVDPELNWLRYNNFRSGDMEAGDGLRAPDAVVASGDVCDLDCDLGRLTVWVHPGNEGAGDANAPGTTVELYAEIAGDLTLIDTQPVDAPLTAGDYLDSVQFDVVSDDLGRFDAVVAVIVTADLECDPGNNSVRIAGPFCGG